MNAKLEEAKIAERKAWRKLVLEEQRIGNEIDQLKEELRRIEEDWREKHDHWDVLNDVLKGKPK